MNNGYRLTSRIRRTAGIVSCDGDRPLSPAARRRRLRHREPQVGPDLRRLPLAVPPRRCRRRNGQGEQGPGLGLWSGRKEIEAVAVDDPLGCVYYADEGFGVRKYRADPDAPEGGMDLARFATTGFAGDQEGISIYPINDGTGYILVSDQAADRFHVFRREGEPGNPHSHPVVRTFRVRAHQSDGSEVTNASLGPRFPAGCLIAMSNEGTFHFYSWAEIAGTDLAVAPGGVRLRLQGR